MSAQGGERIAADGGTWVLRLALTHGVALLKLVSEVGKVGLLPFLGSQLLFHTPGKGILWFASFPFTPVPFLAS